MPIVNVRELARSTSRVIDAVARTRRPAVITKGGRPIALVSALDPDDVEDWILANAPEFVRGMRQADADLSAGRTVPLDEVLGRPRTRARRTSSPPRQRRQRAG